MGASEANRNDVEGRPRRKATWPDAASHAGQPRAAAQPRGVLNLAAESPVDWSIHEPKGFVQTNVVGRFRLVEAAPSARVEERE
jgi:dTDP-D-glucose 4,6-dehydratase